MLDGIYYNPTKIYFGRGMELAIGHLMKVYASMVLLHYGQHSLETSELYTRVTDALELAHISYIPLGGVRPNPKEDLVYKGITLCKSFPVEGIIAVGGGSVIDSAKAISIGAKYDGDVHDLFSKYNTVEALPLGVILTIVGSGSESSRSTVINWTNPTRKLACNADCLFPKFAILNPELTYTVPKQATACGIIDAIMHIMERYVSSTLHVRTTDAICEGLLQTLLYYGPLAITHLNDYNIRAEVMWACKLAQDNSMGFGRKQDWSSHRIAHALGAIYDQPHGILVGIIGSAWLDYVDWTRTLTGVMLRIFLKKLGLPTSLREMGITKEYFDDVATVCTEPMPSGTIGNYQRLAPKDIVEVLKIAYGM
jgi:alcohol dehydrogenase YqhD (iron-dependent ADH family)